MTPRAIGPLPSTRAGPSPNGRERSGRVHADGQRLQQGGRTVGHGVVDGKELGFVGDHDARPIHPADSP